MGRRGPPLRQRLRALQRCAGTLRAEVADAARFPGSIARVTSIEAHHHPYSSRANVLWMLNEVRAPYVLCFVVVRAHDGRSEPGAARRPRCADYSLAPRQTRPPQRAFSQASGAIPGGHT